MSDKTSIEWTGWEFPDGRKLRGATWNPLTGCTKTSPGCAKCYIEDTPAFRIAGRKFEKGHIPLVFHKDRITQPLRWREPRGIFVNSLSDLHRKGGDPSEWRSDLRVRQYPTNEGR